jgi:hypothetical protein
MAAAFFPSVTILASEVDECAPDGFFALASAHGVLL